MDAAQNTGAAQEMTAAVYRRSIWAVGGFAAAVAGLIAAFEMAGQAAAGDERHFVVFWVAAAVGMIPLVALGVHRDTPARVRVAAVWGAAVLTSVPKALRGIEGPVYSDEFGHLYQTKRVLAEGFLAEGENPLLRVAPEFPLLHNITALVHRGGVELWDAAMAVSLGAHVLTLVGVYCLVRRLSGSARVGAAGAMVYAAQPGWLFFSSQYAYETLGLCLLVWTLVAALAARAGSGWRRGALLAAVPAMAGATATTHHFAALTLAALLVAFVAVGATRSTRGSHLPVRSNDVWVAALGVAAVAAWMSSRWGALGEYYNPTVEAVSEKLADPFADEGSRVVFSGSQAPLLEQMFGFAFPFAVLGLMGWSSVVVRARVFTASVHGVAAALGWSFFVSLPLLFVTEGAEASHRWWAYAYLGVAFVVAEGLVAAGERTRALPPPPPGGARTHPYTRVRVAGAALLVVAAIGGVVSGTNVAYRFPGPLEVGNDARSISPEAREMGEYLLETYGPGAENGFRVLADRYTSQQLVGYGEQITGRPSPGYPAWDLFSSTDPGVLRDVARHLRNDRVRFVVVDTRMATAEPVMGFWFTRSEVGLTPLPYPAAGIAKFECAPWSRFVHEVGTLRLYEIDVEELARIGEVCPGAEGEGAAFGFVIGMSSRPGS